MSQLEGHRRIGGGRVGIFAFAPDLAAAALPLLILAICPLSMLLMMSAMNGMDKGAMVEAPTGDAAGRGEQLAQLKAQQKGLAEKIADLEAETALAPTTT